LGVGLFGIRNRNRNQMTLKSALQDLRETTLAAVSGLLAKLAYLGSLRRREGGYLHWGMSLVHGEESSERALKAAHAEVLSTVLRTPIADLVEDLRESSQDNEQTAGAYVDGLREQLSALLPSPQDAPTARHLNSVLIALSSLEKNRKVATPSAS
jgi:D-serine deaminase-like pyridoxal phosphate-dependent protein